MLSVAEARQRILSQIKPVTSETLPLIACCGRALAAEVTASTDFPLFDNSSMDGFALRAVDTVDTAGSRVTLRVVADIPAGAAPQLRVGPGEAARIMTGAQLPDGADAVIPVEDTDFDSRDAGTPVPQEVSISREVRAGENIRRRGMDLRAGETVLQKGRVLKPQDLGLLAMLGISSVQVYRKPRVALLSSGDELLEVDAPLEAGKIRDSNSYTLAALLESAGAEVIRLGVAGDTGEAVQSLLQKAVQVQADLILSSAGVSVGAFDYVKVVIESNGKLDFWQVNMRPGKPLAFGEYKGVGFIGLPGNPVSAFVGFEVFVRDVIGKLGGRSTGTREKVHVRCGQEILSDGRESYLRAILDEQDGTLVARLTGHQGSGNLLSLVQADALLIIPAGVKCVPAGQKVEAWLL
jgi:molybdopterin molybdotransferase